MKSDLKNRIEEARQAAIEVLEHNSRGPFKNLPRTAGWGYPEPYTRDLMISVPGFLLSGVSALEKTVRRVLKALASAQSVHGRIPALAHDSKDHRTSDTTPLFLVGLAFYRSFTGDRRFLEGTAKKALEWMEYQSPHDGELTAQLPTSDWRDEQWVWGFGLYNNVLNYAALRLFGRHKKALALKTAINRPVIRGDYIRQGQSEGLALKDRPYFALWCYKLYSSDRFDLLGNSLAVLSGVASRSRSRSMMSWLESETAGMKKRGLVCGDLAPNFLPFVRPEDDDWMPRYGIYNQPGEYHNGGIWPFVSGFHIAALVAARHYKMAEKKLDALTDLVRLSINPDLDFGFNEWARAQDGSPEGQDFQTWSAAMYVYAAACVERRITPFWDRIRGTA